MYQKENKKDLEETIKKKKVRNFLKSIYTFYISALKGPRTTYENHENKVSEHWEQSQHSSSSQREKQAMYKEKGIKMTSNSSTIILYQCLRNFEVTLFTNKCLLPKLSIKN